MACETESSLPGQDNSSISGAIDAANARKGQTEPSKRGRKPLPRDASGNIIRNEPSIQGGSSTPVCQIDKEAIKKGISALVTTIDRISLRYLNSAALAVTGGDKQFAANLCQVTGMTVDELDLISTMGTEVMAKYELLAKYSAELFLGTALFGYGVRQVSAWNSIRDMRQLLEKNAHRGIRPNNEHSAQADKAADHR